MTLETLYFITQIVAVGAILISLVFVGIQMRDANRLARAQMHHQIADGFTQLMQLVVDDSDDFFEAFYSAEAYQRLNRSKLETFNARQLAAWKYYENVYYQHKNGFVADEYWQSTTRLMVVLINREGIRYWWDARKNTFALEFVSLVDNLEAPDMPVDMKTLGRAALDAGDGAAQPDQCKGPPHGS